MWKVVVVAVVDQGETDEKPTPAPKASRISVSDAAATPPARMAPHETADAVVSGAPDSISMLGSMVVSRSMVLLPSGCSQRLIPLLGTACRDRLHNAVRSLRPLSYPAPASRRRWLIRWARIIASYAIRPSCG